MQRLLLLFPLLAAACVAPYYAEPVEVVARPVPVAVGNRYQGAIVAAPAITVTPVYVAPRPPPPPPPHSTPTPIRIPASPTPASNKHS
jgi:hypothetical protein